MWSCGRRVLMRATAIAFVAIAFCAASALAAKLTVTVRPTTVHPTDTYTITITGHYGRRSVHTTPSLLAFIQYTGAACQRTATAEYALPVSDWSWVFYPQHAEHHPSFKGAFYEEARSRLGERRVCAYLYPKAINPQSTEKPLVRAGAAFTNVKK